MSDNVQVQYEPDVEIAREDVLGKLLTVVDKSDYFGHINHLVNISPKQKMTPGATKIAAPFHKMCFKCVVYDPKPGGKDRKGSWLQYLDVEEFLALAKLVLNNNTVPDKGVYKTVAEFVGYSEKKKEAKTLEIKIMQSSKDATKASYALSFMKGPAEPNSSSVGFSYTGEKEIANIILPEFQFKKILSTSQDYLESLRTAVITRYYEPLYGKKNV